MLWRNLLRKIIPIVFNFDNNYVVPPVIAFFSLLNNVRRDTFYEIFVLHCDVSAENQYLLQSTARKANNANLTFIDTNSFLVGELQSGNFYKILGREGIIYRRYHNLLFIARFLPQYDKVIILVIYSWLYHYFLRLY